MPFWNSFIPRISEVQQHYDSRVNDLKPIHSRVLGIFLSLGITDRQTSIERTKKLYNTSFGKKATWDTVRRAIETAVKVLDGSLIYLGPKRQEILTKSKRFSGERQLAEKVSQDPQFMQSLNDRERTFLNEFFLTDRENTPSHIEFEKTLGVHESTVSRLRTKLIKKMEKHLSQSSL